MCDVSMILNVSGRTDIVAFYTEWFMNRYKEGYVMVRNPFNYHLVNEIYFEDDNGTYRSHGEGVKKDDEIIFMAPDSILVPTFMNNLFTFINENNNSMHLVILSAIFHYYLVYIHPFTDGNGRIARFWVSLMLRNYNSNFEYIPIKEEIYINKEKYYNAIAESHNNNANVFIDFMLDIILSSVTKIVSE